MKSTKELLGSRVKELRKKAQMSQEELAERIGINYKNLSRIEAGRGYPTLETLETIAKVLNLEIRDFFEFHHLDSADSVAEAINTIVKTASDKDLQLFLKFLRALIR
jgi:transcriptional regulator with XRE-family HTH domain